MSTITLTFSECVENQKGMEMIGKKAEKGFTNKDLEKIKEKLNKEKYVCELINLNDEIKNEDDADETEKASLLIIRNAISFADELKKEQDTLDVDKKALMRKRVVNKKARYNLCFSDISQEPNYEKGKGRIYSFDELPFLKRLREEMFSFLENKKAENLKAEGNYYYDVNKCYIGWHGDTERSKVIGVRLGSSFPLSYNWYRKSKRVGNVISRVLNHGDMYIMSEKAVGNDWLKKNTLTLRHSAGILSLKELKEKVKKVKKVIEESSSSDDSSSDDSSDSSSSSDDSSDDSSDSD